MAGLLSSLTAADNGSQEVFHSARSSPETGDNDQNHDLHSRAMQANGLAVYDVDSFLNDPNNQLLLNDRSTTKKGKTAQSSQNPNNGSSSTTEPIQLGGPRTSQHVKQLYEICQSRGLQPEFEYEGDDSCFSGSITINDETISIDQKFRSKKDVKEALAEAGIEIAKRVAQDIRPMMATDANNQVNWIGKLLGKQSIEAFFREARTTHGRSVPPSSPAHARAR